MFEVSYSWSIMTCSTEKHWLIIHNDGDYARDIFDRRWVIDIQFATLIYVPITYFTKTIVFHNASHLFRYNGSAQRRADGTRRARQLNYRAACLRAVQATRPLELVLGCTRS